MITIFTAPKPFIDPHISAIQYNAISSWLELGPDVEVLLLGDEPGLSEAANHLGVELLRLPSRALSGAPLVSELFQTAQKAASNPVLGYVNADVILLDDFVPAVKLVSAQTSLFLIVGNRWDIEIHQRLQIRPGWRAQLRRRLWSEARRHPPMGSDYFVFRAGQFVDLPNFTLGRAGWDNWMMYRARTEGIPLIDASAVITAVHQQHDYGHLPGGRPHYRHPESLTNIQLAGGYEAMFRLRDADWLLTAEGLRPKNLMEWQWPRKIEADLISGFGTGRRAKLTRMFFHPFDAVAYLRSRMVRANAPTANNSEKRSAKP